MDPLKVLRIYLALRAHYSTKNYDIFKYNGAVKNCTYEQLNKNKARQVLIERLAKRFKLPSEIMGYLFPQWLYSNGTSLYNPIDSEENYVRWQKFKANPNYYIAIDLAHLDLDKIVMDEPSVILKEVSSGNIKLESAIAINKVKPFIDPSKDYFGFNTMCNTIVKSTNFIKFDEEIVRMELGYEAA